MAEAPTMASGPGRQPVRAQSVAFHEDHRRAAADLVANGSIEFSCGSPGQIREVSAVLPFGTPVFVPVLPLHDLGSRVEIIAGLRENGFDPVPHLAARRIGSRESLAGFLRAAVDAGQVHRVLLIGGDSRGVSGPYEDAAALLADGVLAEAGISEVAFAGYPEGHPRIPSADLDAALAEKLSFALEQGLGTQVVTQFSFVPRRIIEYCVGLASRHPEVPVYVGMAGPANARQLVHFARYCGVSASLSAVGKVGVRIAQLADHARADEQLGLVASYTASHASSNVVGVHLFSFGGFLETASWMGERLNG